MKYYFLPIYLTKFTFHLFSEQNWHDKRIFNNVNTLNNSSPMENAVTNKKKHFSQLFALGPQTFHASRNKMTK